MNVDLTQLAEPGSDRPAPLTDAPLVVMDVDMRFGGTVALTDVSLSVARGERVGLIGPNGAGKTTLLEIVSGALRPSSGRIVRFGRDVTRLSAESRAREGIGRTFQQSSRFGALTAVESVAIAILSHRNDRPFLKALIGQSRVHHSAMETARTLLAELGVDAFGDVPAGDLPLGIARLVDIARAISGRPDLLLLDEPSSGLDDDERERLRSFLEHHADESGCAFLLVEHDVEFVRSLCQRIVVLDFGVKIADAPTAEVLRNPAVRAAYLGQEEDTRAASGPEVASPAVATPAPGSDARATTASGASPALELRDLSAGYGRSTALHHISVAIPAGAAVAVLGPNGAGKSTLARVLAGQLRPTSGRILLHGTDVTELSAASMARLGVFHVPDSRAIYPSLTVRENLVMAFRHRIDKRQVTGGVERVVDLFPALGRHLKTRAGMLSGGEQQMLALAPAIAQPPSVLVLDELSHGLSPLIVGRLFEILATVKGEVTTVVIEQFAERALTLADEVIALRRGRIAFQGPTAGVTPDDVASWYALEDPGTTASPAGHGSATVGPGGGNLGAT